MLTISPALSSSQAIKYHAEEFAHQSGNYYSEAGSVIGQWHGRLAEEFGLTGAVHEHQFTRLAEGRHPSTGEQLVQHKSAHVYLNSRGGKVCTVEHRAGFDMCFNAPKTISLTALVGGDQRVREAHSASVDAALEELERYTQARMGGNIPAVTTGAWVVAKFEHDTARQVGDRSSPHLHHHCLAFNVTTTLDGKTRALQGLEIFRAQRVATAHYRSELAFRLRRMGYKIEQGQYGQPEIFGYDAAYVLASSERRQQILKRLGEQGLSGAAAAQIAAYQTRNKKSASSRSETLAKHLLVAAEHGNQPERVIAAAALSAGYQANPSEVPDRAASAVSYAERRNFERAAVTDERDLLADSLNQSQGFVRLPEVRKALQNRIAQGALIEMSSQAGACVREFTTREMREQEQTNIDIMRAGIGKCHALVGTQNRLLTTARHAHLSVSQRAAVDAVLTNQDRFVAVEGGAGTGKTTIMAAIREASVLDGYEIQGLAPTSKAAKKLAEAGMKTETLQMHLTRRQSRNSEQKQLYVLDESSLSGTLQMRDFLERLHEMDRVILVGDSAQHQAILAGVPFLQLQTAGMQTVRLSEIVRQKEPGLKSVVEDLARGNVRHAIAKMQEQGRVHEIIERKQRIEAITSAYLEKPEETLVVSPDNRSRCEINESVHSALRAAGRISGSEHTFRVLEAQQNMTAADRQQAVRYAEGEVIRYSRGSEQIGISASEYVQVTGIDGDRNLLTVKRRSNELITYDPRRLSGVQVYHEVERAFARGDRVQLTAPLRKLKLANREMGSIEQIEDDTLFLKMNDGREIALNVSHHPHIEYGFATTSYSSQGQTCDRVIVNVDSDQARGKLLNSRFAYVAISRAQFDAQIYTNDEDSLAMHLSRNVSQRSAIESIKEMPVDPNGIGESSTIRTPTGIRANALARDAETSYELIS
jgi:conjugative relaxase-like TrwC/TraI family protein